MTQWHCGIIDEWTTKYAFGGTYLELLPETTIRSTDVFEDPNLPGEIVVTVGLEAVSCGTALRITQEGVPDAIPSKETRPPEKNSQDSRAPFGH